MMPVVAAFIVPHPPLIVPEVGGGRQKDIAGTIKAYEEISRRIAQINPHTIILTTPHSVMYSDYIHISPGSGASGDFGEFGAPKAGFEVSYDEELAAAISSVATEKGISAGTEGEKKSRLDHGCMVPLYFLSKYFNFMNKKNCCDSGNDSGINACKYTIKDFCKVVRIGLSGLSYLDHYRFGMCITAAISRMEDLHQQGGEQGKAARKYVIIASGDLSHKLTYDGPYGYAKEGLEFDREVTDAMSKGDFGRFLSFDEDFCEAAAECGLRSFIIMAGALDRKEIKPELLSYEGPFGVGYAVAAFIVTGDNAGRGFGDEYEQSILNKATYEREKEDAYVSLARQSLECCIKEGKKIKRNDKLPAEMTGRKAGTFVSLKINGRLRGCIGTIAPTTLCIADEIINNAVSAGTADPRFEPVRKDELQLITYSVDVLGDAEPIGSMDELDVKKYGVIVTSGGKRGLLLPDLDGVDTPQQQVAIALKKAGIPEGSRYSMERFEVVRHY